MGRPRKLSPWMVDALALGLTPAQISSKVARLRRYKAKKYDLTLAEMEAVLGWDLDEMASSLVHTIAHERCRGPRCGRVRFKDIITADYLLSIITCDVLDPETPPLWCMNIRWCCEQDNKGDRDMPMRDRAKRLVEERTLKMDPVKNAPHNDPGWEEQTLW